MGRRPSRAGAFPFLSLTCGAEGHRASLGRVLPPSPSSGGTAGSVLNGPTALADAVFSGPGPSTPPQLVSMALRSFRSPSERLQKVPWRWPCIVECRVQSPKCCHFDGHCRAPVGYGGGEREQTPPPRHTVRHTHTRVRAHARTISTINTLFSQITMNKPAVQPTAPPFFLFTQSAQTQEPAFRTMKRWHGRGVYRMHVCRHKKMKQWSSSMLLPVIVFRRVNALKPHATTSANKQCVSTANCQTRLDLAVRGCTHHGPPPYPNGSEKHSPNR